MKIKDQMNDKFQDAACDFTVACDHSGCDLIVQSYILYRFRNELDEWRMEDALNKIRRELKNLNDKWAAVETAMTSDTFDALKLPENLT